MSLAASSRMWALVCWSPDSNESLTIWLHGDGREERDYPIRRSSMNDRFIARKDPQINKGLLKNACFYIT